MIIGKCPYEDCDGDVWEPMGPAGAWQQHDCETCERTIWTYHSRLAPVSVTDAEFRAEYTVDDATHIIRKKETVS